MGKVELVNAFAKTVLPKTGTKIEKGIYDLTAGYNAFEGNHFGSLLNMTEKGVTKLITYGENTSMARMGINQVAITHFPKSGNRQYVYLRDGKSVNQIYTNKQGVVTDYQKGGCLYCYRANEKNKIGSILRPFIDAVKQFSV